MSYRILYDRSFARQIESLPGDLRSVVRRQIKSLADDPRPSQSKELDEHPTYYRIWLPRHHRLVYQVIDDDQIVDLLYVGPKTPDLYEQLGLGRE